MHNIYRESVSVLKEGLPGYPHVSFDDLATLSEALCANELLLEALLQLFSLLSSVAENGIEVQFFELLEVTLGSIGDSLSQMILSLYILIKSCGMIYLSDRRSNECLRLP